MLFDTNNAFNADFECPAHKDDVLDLNISLVLHWVNFLACTILEVTYSTLAFPGLLFSANGSCAVGDPCSTIILKLKVSFNHF